MQHGQRYALEDVEIEQPAAAELHQHGVAALQFLQPSVSMMPTAYALLHTLRSYALPMYLYHSRAPIRQHTPSCRVGMRVRERNVSAFVR